MNALKNLFGGRPRTAGALLWLLSLALMVACIIFQDRTGPTQPLEGEFDTAAGPVRFRFLRSQNIGLDLPVMLLDPVPAGVEGLVRFRRHSSHDEWKTVVMAPMEAQWTRRGSGGVMKGIGAKLPGLNERAGKYEFFVMAGAKGEEPVSITGDRAVLARYKGAVPVWVLLAHIVAIFASMTFAIRTALDAAVGGESRWLLFATLASLLAGAFVLGPLVQHYAFGVWWSGIPFGWDWTDNKVLLELLAWIPALALNIRGRRNRISVIAAGAITMAVYFIPHSLFGSQYDYKTGTGRGTAGAVLGPADAPKPPDQVAATVGGFRIMESDVLAGIPEGLPEDQAASARKARIALLAQIAADRAFLSSRGITVRSGDVEGRIAMMRAAPPLSDCGCCRHESLEEYLRENLMTMGDLRASIANEIGLDMHCESEWERAYPTEESREELARDNRGRLLDDYISISHVYFDKGADPAAASARASAALERIKNGEPFESVAAELSEDRHSVQKGGAVGIVSAGFFGAQMKKAVAAAKPGDVFGPVDSGRGFHVVRKETPPDSDLAPILKEEFLRKTRLTVLRSIRQNGSR